MTAIEKLINIADAEVGYLEKKSNAQLDDKTANSGTANYTKYWRDIKPELQGQAWCAAFVTWCFVIAFGKEMAKKLLKHYPYVYCPTMASLFTLNANPKKGDIVIFYRNGTFAHTGIVTSVSGDYFTTIEGNTSGGNNIIANGGGVCRKGYYNSKLPGTKFCTPDYSLIESEGEPMTTEERTKFNELVNAVAELSAKVDKLKGNQPMIYNYIDSNMPDWAKPTIQKMLNKDLLQGDENGRLGLTDEMLRIFVINDRAGVYGD